MAARTFLRKIATVGRGLCRSVEDWRTFGRNDPDRIAKNAAQLTKAIQQAVTPPAGKAEAFSEATLEHAAEQIASTFDSVNGGFGTQPKFPHPMDLAFLWRRVAATGSERYSTVARLTLDKMAAGGIYDQLGGGFHRYSVDDHWLIPHFEKMLYDNALLAEVYLDGALVSQEERYRVIVADILAYVAREMTAPSGAFYSTQDADSEGVEGKFFAWTPAQLEAVLGKERGALATAFFGVTESGNFEHGTSVLWRPQTAEEFASEQGMSLTAWQSELATIRQELFASREQRVHPGRDEKILMDWNGMMIGAFARAGFHLDNDEYIAAARRAADFCLQEMVVDGRALRTYKDGRARLMANLGDYALLVDGLLKLYQAGHEPRYLRAAQELTQVTLDHFWDEQHGGFFFTADDHEQLIARSKEAYDGATPAAASVHIGNLLRLSEILGDSQLRERAMQTLEVYQVIVEQHPRAVSHMMTQLAFSLSEPKEVVVVGSDVSSVEPFLQQLRTSLAPERVLLVVTEENRAELSALTSLIEGKEMVDGKPTAYVCQNFSCQAPTTDPEVFKTQWRP